MPSESGISVEKTGSCIGVHGIIDVLYVNIVRSLTRILQITGCKEMNPLPYCSPAGF